jgi:hypothetical protein
MSMHSMCMMYTLMLKQLVPVPTSLLTRTQKIHTALCSVYYQKVHFTTTSVTLCGHSGATISIYSIRMMDTFTLEQLVAVSTVALTRGHTYTLHCVAYFTRRCTLQPLV